MESSKVLISVGIFCLFILIYLQWSCLCQSRENFVVKEQGKIIGSIKTLGRALNNSMLLKLADDIERSGIDTKFCSKFKVYLPHLKRMSQKLPEDKKKLLLETVNEFESICGP